MTNDDITDDASPASATTFPVEQRAKADGQPTKDTPLIAASFSRGAQAYDTSAAVQYRVASEFMRWLTQGNLPLAKAGHLPDSPNTHQLRIVELGCGTGFLTQQLLHQIPGTNIHACDISAEMLTQCRIRTQGTVSLHQADASHFQPFEKSDWTLSSFCLQWVDDIAATLAFQMAHTQRLSICLPCSASFGDWRQAHEACGLTPSLWPLPEALELTQQMRLLTARMGGTLRTRTENMQEHHDSPLAFARHLRAIGADHSNKRGQHVSLQRVLSALPTPYTAVYEVLMLDWQQ